MTTPKRQDDPTLTEFIEVITQLTTDFTPHPDHPRYRVPAHATPLDPISDFVGVDSANDPHSISRTIFAMEWDSLPGYSTFWHLHALRLSSGERVYWVDDFDGRRIIAVGPGGVGSDGLFARALFKSNGQAFRAGVLDSLPSRVSTRLRGKLLIDLFVSAISHSPNASDALGVVSRSTVRWWLKDVLARRGKELRAPLTKAQAQREFISRVGGIVSDFTPHAEDAGVRVPRRFTPLHALAKTLGKKIDPLLTSVSYQLFRFAWWSVPGSTFIQRIGAILLPDGSRVFWFYLEADPDEEQQFYVAGTASSDVTDLRFLRLLFKDNGKAFGVEVFGAAPNEVITPLRDAPELPELFVAAYNGFPQAWESLDACQIAGRWLDAKDPSQARLLVERHLRAVISGRHRPERG